MFERPSKQGFSLLEILAGLGIMAMMMAMGFSSLNSSKPRGDSLAMTMELKGIFSQARAQAAATGKPVGIVFPTQGGASPVVQECLILTGVDTGQLQRRLAFTGNYPGVGLFVGSWATPSGSTFAAHTVSPGTEEARFVMADWLPPEVASDAAYVFLPGGSVLTNGQFHLDGEFPVVVATAMTFTTGSAAGGTLQAASDAHTVFVSTDSTIRTQKGVAGGQVPAGGTDGWSPGTATVPAVAASAAPVIEKVDLLPTPVDPVFAAAAGVQGVVEAGGVVTFEVTASDANGGPLFCQWTSTDGEFSHASETPMLYNPEEGQWVSFWHWRAPDTAAPDTVYDFTLAVRDESAPATAGAGTVVAPKVMVVPEGRVLFCSKNEGGSHVFVSRFDGTDLRAVFGSYSGSDDYDSGFSQPDVSRDGRRVAIGANRNNWSLKVLSIDGAEFKELGNPLPFNIEVDSSQYDSPVFSADGTKIYVTKAQYPALPSQVVFSFDPAGNPIVSASPFPGSVRGFSPDGTMAVVQNGSDVVLCDATGAITSTLKTNAKALDWNFDGVWYADNLTGNGSNPGTMDIHKIQADGSGDTVVLTGTSGFSAVGGDGRYIFYPGSGGLFQKDLVSTTDRMVIKQFENPGSDDSMVNFREIATSR